jgi:hypothetical protein
VAEAVREKESQATIAHAREPGLTIVPSSLMAWLIHRSAQLGCGGGGGRDPNACAFRPFTLQSLTGEGSLDEATQGKLVSFIASGTFMSGRFLRYLMHFRSSSGSTELYFTITANGITTQSREWMQFGVDIINRTLQCREFAIFL